MAVIRVNAAPLFGLIISLPGAASCFGDTGDMELRWTIGGTIDGVDQTLDRCDEVAAASVRLEALDGPGELDPRVVPCHNGRGQFYLLDDIDRGNWTMRATLLDAQGGALTQPTTASVAVNARQGLGRFHFAPEAFIDSGGQPLVRDGTYRFRLGYARPAAGEAFSSATTSCLRLPPPRPTGQRVRLSRVDGTPVTLAVCAAGRCAPSDGSAGLPCVDAELIQTFGPLPWGSYDIGFVGVDADDRPCWTGSARIVVGAGDNPVVDHVATLVAPCISN